MIDRRREKEINLFLRRLAYTSRTNTLDDKDIYRELIFNNLPPQKRVDLSAYFDYWQKMFANDLKTQVYVQNGWEFFCQFVNRDIQHNKPNLDPVKIYVALKPEFLAEGANQIFKFLADNNIKHRSKIGRILRDDNIVIRVYDLKEAKKLINFINNNKYLMKGHMPVSPFCFHEGIVGLAMDNHHSYNSIICGLISKYLEQKKALRQLDTVNCQDLCNFVVQFDLYQAFRNKDISFIDSISDLEFVNEIKNLFIKNLSSSDINEFYRHYYSVSKNKHLVNDSQKNNYNVSSQTQTSNMLDDLIVAMQGTATKYDEMWVYSALKRFLMNGDMSGFTRIDAFGNQCRSRLIKHNYQIMRLEIYKKFLGVESLANVTIPEFYPERVMQLTDYFYGEYYQKNKDYSK